MSQDKVWGDEGGKELNVERKSNGSWVFQVLNNGATESEITLTSWRAARIADLIVTATAGAVLGGKEQNE